MSDYLEVTLQAVGLIRTNLERIGRLTDAFREAAIDSNLATRRRFRFKACLDDVIASLGDNLPTDRIVVRILCDEDMEINSFPGNWVSIFINLITNSLHHAFTGREHGCIEVAVTTKDHHLVVDYSDDGIVLSTEVQAHIFDPFFTTDLAHGIGLGTHFVYNLITRLGGSITCDSHPGQGIHFHIETPLGIGRTPARA